jgi:hypothetical protein
MIKFLSNFLKSNREKKKRKKKEKKKRKDRSMAHQTPKWFSQMVMKDIGVAVGLAAIGGGIFRYWHKGIYIPRVQDYYAQIEDNMVARLEEAERDNQLWLANEKPRLEKAFDETLYSIAKQHKEGVFEGRIGTGDDSLTEFDDDYDDDDDE